MSRQTSKRKQRSYNSSKHHDNLSREERQALRNLRSRQDIIIKPADKGSSVVIMSRDDYISEGVRQLSNQSTYQKLNEDPTQKHLEKVRESVEDLEEENDVKKHMVPKTANCPNLYFLPKIHKPNNPGRPIVSGCSCPTAQISKYLDHHLRPFVAKLPSYTQDTTHFLNHMEHFNSDLCPLSTRTILVTADVTSLYTNIPHGEGIQACREALETRVTQRPPTDQLIRLLELILKVNNFQFNGENYLQIEGTAMGTPVAPTYANMFMGNLEKRILSHANSIIFQRSWKRYIDDIFFLWSGSPRSLLKLQDTMNAMHPTIKFTFDSSNETTHFLDVTLTLNNGKITTDLYTKPTDTHAYLLPSSSHPKHTFRSIAYSQALRVRRICSDPSRATQRLQELQRHLTDRNYNENMVQDQIKRASEKPREDLLKYKSINENNTDRVFYPTTYSQATQSAPQIIEKHFPTLQQSEQTRNISKNPPMMSYRRGRTLRDILVRARDPVPSTLTTPQGDKETPNGFYKCKSTKCIIHTHITETQHFKSTVTHQQFTINSHITCKSSWIIYLITCTQCNKQYVGKTETTLYTRLNNTRSEIRNFHSTQQKVLPYTIHFNSPSHSMQNLQITGIESIINKSHDTILHRESFWIQKLKTLQPNGINAAP